MSFKDQVVVITGATRGIGCCIAETFAQEGALAVIIGRNKALAEGVRDGILKKGHKDEFHRSHIDSDSIFKKINVSRAQKLIIKVLRN